jgi:hypothetical protein
MKPILKRKLLALYWRYEPFFMASALSAIVLIWLFVALNWGAS